MNLETAQQMGSPIEVSSNILQDWVSMKYRRKTKREKYHIR